MPHDIEKLIKERPEMFDYPNITDLDVDPAYMAEIDKLMPQWFKDFSAKRMADLAREKAIKKKA